MQNINSDQLRKRLAKHTRKMNWLAEQNDLIVELLAQRGLKAIEKTADEDLVFSADKMILTNAGGAEVFNTDWPNPLIHPDQYEAHSRMAEWLDTFQEAKEDRVPLTAKELKAGGWWCDDVSEECRSVFASKGVYARNDDWSNKEGSQYKCCYLSWGVVVRSYLRMEGLKQLKQIHRIGSEFYWGAPNE